jgi:hypothetical protein
LSLNGRSGTFTYNYYAAGSATTQAWWSAVNLSTDGDENRSTNPWTNSESIMPGFQAAAENKIKSNLSSGEVLCAIYPPDGLPSGYAMSSAAFQNSNSNRYDYTYYFWFSTGNPNSDCTSNMSNRIEYSLEEQFDPTRWDVDFSPNANGNQGLSNATNGGKFVFFQDYVSIWANNSSKFDFEGSVTYVSNFRRVTITMFIKSATLGWKEVIVVGIVIAQ